MSVLFGKPEVLWKLATPAEVKLWAEKGVIHGTSLDMQDGFMLAADAIAIKQQAARLYRGLEVELLCIQPEALPDGTKWMRDDCEDTLLSQCVQSEGGAPAYIRRLTSGTLHVHLRKKLPWSAVSQHFSLPVQADGAHTFPGECSELTKPKSASSMVEVIILGTGNSKSHTYYGEPCSSFAVVVDGHAVLLCDIGSGVVRSAIKELGWNGLPSVVFVSHDRSDCANDLPTWLGEEALEKKRHMTVIGSPECITSLKQHRMQEITKSRMCPVRDFAEWVEVKSGQALEVDSGVEGCKMMLEACTKFGRFVGILITVSGVTISWTADCDLAEGAYADYDPLAEYAQLFIAHARKDRKGVGTIATSRNATFEDIVGFVHACAHASFLSEGEGSVEHPISKHRFHAKRESIQHALMAKERERKALTIIIGASFKTRAGSTAPETQPILGLTGMLLRLQAPERMTTDVIAALSKKPQERDSEDQESIDNCERFLRTRLEEVESSANEDREQLEALSTLTSSRSEEQRHICSVVVTGYGSSSDAPTLGTAGIPRHAVLSAGQRLFLSRMNKREIEERMQNWRAKVDSQSGASVEDTVEESTEVVRLFRKSMLKRRSSSVW